MLNEATQKYVLERLKLAQEILEDSDRLPGNDAYDYNQEDWWLHPRHTREALTIYLLLTCFDLLGQPDEFTTFDSWLKSNKTQHKNERDEVLLEITGNEDAITIATKLTEKHNSIYGTKRAFFRGIELVPETTRDKLLKTISIVTKPDYGQTPENVMTPSFPLEDNADLEKRKKNYLFEYRNKFTHSLEQYHNSSIPVLAGANNWGNSSWLAEIRDSQLSYCGGVKIEAKPNSNVGAYIYFISGWPFILFDALYSALNIEFDRKSIKLKFQVLLFNSKFPGRIGKIDNVNHSELKDHLKIEQEYWSKEALKN